MPNATDRRLDQRGRRCFFACLYNRGTISSYTWSYCWLPSSHIPRIPHTPATTKPVSHYPSPPGGGALWNSREISKTQSVRFFSRRFDRFWGYLGGGGWVGHPRGAGVVRGWVWAQEIPPPPPAGCRWFGPDRAHPRGGGRGARRDHSGGGEGAV